MAIYANQYMRQRQSPAGRTPIVQPGGGAPPPGNILGGSAQQPAPAMPQSPTRPIDPRMLSVGHGIGGQRYVPQGQWGEVADLGGNPGGGVQSKNGRAVLGGYTSGGNTPITGKTPLQPGVGQGYLGNGSRIYNDVLSRGPSGTRGGVGSGNTNPESAWAPGTYGNGVVGAPGGSAAAGGYGSGITTPGGTAGSGTGNSIYDQIQRAEDEANAENEQRYGEGKGLITQGRTDLLNDQNASTTKIMADAKAGGDALKNFAGNLGDSLGDKAAGLYSNLSGSADARGQASLDFLGQGTNTQRGLVNSLSDAEYQRADMETQNELGGLKQSLIDRGFMNSTVGDAEKENIKDRAALRRAEIGDRRLDKMLGVEDRATGRGLDVRGQTDRMALDMGGRGAAAQMGAAELGGRLGYDAMADANKTSLGVSQKYADNRMDIMRDSSNQMLDWIGSKTTQGPDLGLYASILGQPRGGASGGVKSSGKPQGGYANNDWLDDGQPLANQPPMATGAPGQRQGGMLAPQDAINSIYEYVFNNYQNASNEQKNQIVDQLLGQRGMYLGAGSRYTGPLQQSFAPGGY